VAYDDRARRLVRVWKDGGRRDLAAVAAAIVVDVVGRPVADVLTAVPSDPERRRARGHAPAEMLAARLAVRWGVPVARLLRRTRRVDRQTGRSADERRANVREAFAATGPVPAVVCLVDDVYTTGATASSCASALRRAGARRVDVVSFARTLRSG
jgi:predicted amidophosphoribosyltransferase